MQLRGKCSTASWSDIDKVSVVFAANSAQYLKKGAELTTQGRTTETKKSSRDSEFRVSKNIHQTIHHNNAIR